jgi:DNA polymerase III gamma/tau subunit
MPLHTKYQVRKLEDIIGNDKIVKSLSSVLDRTEDRPHSFLFTGPSGCGKSTFAEIVRDELDCHKADFFLFNSSIDRGINIIRDIQDSVPYVPSVGDVKFYLLEECFHEDTPITKSDNELLKIKNIKVGDKIKNLHGVDTVEKVFVNKIPLNRVVAVHLSNGIHIVCSKDHLFYTENKEWVKAKNLDNNTFLCFDSNSMSKLTSQEVYNEKELLQSMQQGDTQDKEVLLQQMFSDSQGKTYKKGIQLYMQSMRERVRRSCLEFKALSRVQERENRSLPKMWKRIHKLKSKSNEILFQFMSSKMEKCSTKLSKSSSLKRESESNFFGTQKFKDGESRTLVQVSTRFFKENVKKQSNEESRSCEQNDRNENKKWNISFANFAERWKWLLHRTAINFTPSFALADGGYSANCAGNPKGAKKNFLQIAQLPHPLQTGSSESKTKTIYRSGRRSTQYASGKGERQKERQEIERIRVDRVTFYEQASTGESAFGFISNKEKEQNFVEFYDLQVKENPSYIANGCMVHNCHQLTGQAQEAILEIIHKPPPHVFFALCTTEPEKLKLTLKRRCHKYEVEPLKRGELLKLLTRVLKEEGIEDYPKEILSKIVSASGGSAGIALNLLDTIIDIADDKEALETIEATTVSETAVNEVAQSIMNGDAWSTFSKKVKGLKGDAESLRRAFASYFGKVMIGSKSEEKASIMMEILEPFMDNTTTMYSGKAGLDYSLTFAWFALKPGE